MVRTIVFLPKVKGNQLMSIPSGNALIIAAAGL